MLELETIADIFAHFAAAASDMPCSGEEFEWVRRTSREEGVVTDASVQALATTLGSNERAVVVGKYILELTLAKGYYRASHGAKIPCAPPEEACAWLREKGVADEIVLAFHALARPQQPLTTN